MNQWISAVNSYYYPYMCNHVSHERNVFPQLGIPSDEKVVAHALPKISDHTSGSQIIVIIIAAQTMKHLQPRRIAHLSTSPGLAPEPVYFGSAHDLTGSVIPVQCRGEEA
jgi:hypothetical protein